MTSNPLPPHGIELDPRNPAHSFAVQTWGETWTHAEWGSLQWFVHLMCEPREPVSFEDALAYAAQAYPNVMAHLVENDGPADAVNEGDNKSGVFAQIATMLHEENKKAETESTRRRMAGENERAAYQAGMGSAYWNMAVSIGKFEDAYLRELEKRPVAALSPSPAAGGGVREALEGLFQGPLNSETWGCSDDEPVSLPTTFGAIRRARAALDRQTGEREGERIAQALSEADWRYASIGNKALIRAAIEALSLPAAPRDADRAAGQGEVA